LKKILSIDGGGIKGVFPAAFLAEIEEKLGKPIIDYFDLIVGTSTGGIIALGLGLGFSPREILSMYEDNAEKIFPPKKKQVFWKRNTPELVRCAFESKYSTAPLKDILTKKFEGKLLGQSTTRLMICATNLVTGKVNVFKTAHHERLETDYKRSAVEVALATSAAPYFFSPHQTVWGDSLVDGGLWANNPMGFAAVESINYLNWPREKVAILSVSCTGYAPDFAKLAGTKPGGKDWGLGVVQLAMASQSHASMGMAIHALGDMSLERIKRIEPIVPAKTFSLDGTDKVELLKGLGRDQAKHEKKNLEKLFFSETVEPFVPVYSL